MSVPFAEQIGNRMVPRLGVEPRLTASEAAVLPLDDLGA